MLTLVSNELLHCGICTVNRLVLQLPPSAVPHPRPGGRPELLAGVVKLYASGSGLRSLAGLQHLSAVRYLYLDRNQLPASELLRLTGEGAPA